MPKPHVFESERALVASLRRGSTAKSARAYFSQRVGSIPEVVHSSVGSNTYRAFSNLPVRPSVLFRAWATRHLERSPPPLSGKTRVADYAQYVHASTRALCRHWQRATGTELSYGRGAKLLNLALKRFSCLGTMSENERRALIPLLHVPLDSYTILGLREIAPDLAIPGRATMRFIQRVEQYTAFQERIAVIAGKARVPPIHYDILAWNAGHDG